MNKMKLIDLCNYTTAKSYSEECNEKNLYPKYELLELVK